MRRTMLLRLAAVALLSAGCNGTGDASSPSSSGLSVSWPAAPSDASALVHVCGSCTPAGTPDGSGDSPFTTISEAVAAAPPGAAILVAGGTYAETLLLDKPVSILGGKAATSDGVVLSSPGPGAAVTVQGTQGVVLRGLWLAAPVTAGIQVVGGAATVESCVIDGARTDPDGLYGFGILGVGGAHLVLRDVTVKGAAQSGLVLDASEGEVEGGRFEGNARGGIRLLSTPPDGDPVRIEGTVLEGNAEFGIGLFSAHAIILTNLVSTTAAGGPAGSADGIIAKALEGPDGSIGAPSDLDLRDSQVFGNARAGVLLGKESRGIILTNLVSDNAVSGIWLQQGAGGPDGVRVEDNDLRGNGIVGIGLTTSARALVKGNDVSGSWGGGRAPSGAGLGDGIGVFAGAAATIEHNEIHGNARAGILTDGADAKGTVIVDNTIASNDGHPVVLQNLVAGVEPTLSGNTFESNQAGDQVEVVGPDDQPLPVSKADLTPAP